jgi:type II secretory pathway pseudopilin PulG
MHDAIPTRLTAVDPRRRQRDGGYLLLAILLMMALMIIAATIEAPRIVQQMKRDREEEMIHRGTEYARAIKKFYKKFGRYPTSLEQLDNTNQIRFLRKRYKDPLTKDGKWTLLHYGDIQTLLNRNAPGTPAASLSSQGQTGQAGQAGQLGSVLSSTAASAPFTNSSTSDGSGGAIPANSNQAVQYMNNSTSDGSAGGFAGGSTGGVGAGSQPANSSGIGPLNSPNGQTGPAGQSSSNVSGQSSAAGNPTFGGGAIVGVASLSKDPTIRIYNKKKKYDEWVFIYDPMSDVGNFLLRGPYQPLTLGGAQVGTPAGQINGQQQPSTFGQQPGSAPQQNGPQRGGPGSQFPPDQNQPQE